MLSGSSVMQVEVNDHNTAAVYEFLKSKSGESRKGGLFRDGIKLNFTKFLVDKHGNVKGYFPRMNMEVLGNPSLLIPYII